MTHLEERLEKDLNNLHGRVGVQARQVIEAVENAVHALQTGNRELAYATVLNDHSINRTMREIDRLCHSFIAVHLPSAGHLRVLSAVIRANIEMERIGDYAVTIAREAVQLPAPPEGQLARDLDRMASETLLMLRQAIKAFRDLNADMAKSTMVMADQMEHNLDAIYAAMMANDEHEQLKQLLALFAVFTQVKRVADQAKNLCEETVFAVTGEQKSEKVYRILFIDEDNGLKSQLAEAIGRNQFPDSGRYRSAGRAPATALDAQLVSFAQQRGLDLGAAAPKPLADLTAHDLADQHVIVSLQGLVSSYIPEVPFHTVALNWDVSDAGEGDQATDMLYREIALQLKDLMESLRGEGAS